MDQGDFLCIKMSDLDKILGDQSRVLCGKVCKRFELDDNKESIKKQAKELIYENFRSLKDLLVAYNSGLTQTTKWEFIQRKDSAD